MFYKMFKYSLIVNKDFFNKNKFLKQIIKKLRKSFQEQVYVLDSKLFLLFIEK